MRLEVLRLSNDIGRERERPFVIAIDGIDHAARSSEPNAKALLASLPEPEHLPPHVRLLIAGQPPEAWPQYPFWLRDPQGCFLRRNAPRISDEDVASLVDARCPKELKSHVVVTRLVSDAANGDTLAAVFAVEESRLATSPDELRERLAQRQLHSGVRAYYAQIWDTLAARLGTEHPFDALRLGAVLALYDQRVSATMLAKLFAERNVLLDDWQEALLSLRPLVIEEHGAFRLMHNDIRVFLGAKLRAEPERARLVATRLAEYCRADPDAGDSRFTLTFEMLKLAGRDHEIPRVFDAEFVVSGWRRGLSFDLLERRGAQAARALTGLPPEWDTLHSLVCALLTLQQLDNSTDRLGFSKERAGAASARVVPAQIAECRVLATHSWSEEQVGRALRDAELLLNAGETERAQGLLCRWFRKVTPPQLKMHIQAATTFSSDHAGDSKLRSYGAALWRAFGRDVFRTEPIEQSDGAAWATFYAGYLDAADTSKAVSWARAFSAIRMLHFEAIEGHVTELATSERWMCTAFAFQHLQQFREKLSNEFTAEAGVWSLLIGRKALINGWVAPLEKDLFQFVAKTRSHDRASLAVAAAFIQGWRTWRPLEAIREDAVNAYGRHSRPDAIERITLLCFGAATVGRWLGFTVPPALEVARTLFARLLEHVRPLDLYREYPRLAPILVRLLIEAGRRSGSPYADAFIGECEAFATAGRHGPAMPTVWRVLRQSGRLAVLAEWIEMRFGSRGGGWELDTADRVSELQVVAALCRTVPSLEAKADELDRLKRAAALGYLNDDEYVLTYPLEWFRSFAATNPASWESYGFRLLGLSREAEIAGDNRQAPGIEGAIACTATLSGPNALARLKRAMSDSKRWFELNSRHWIDGVVKALSALDLDAESFLALWSMFLSQLSWRERDDLAYLRDIADALDSYATLKGLTPERTRMEEAARLEWTIARSSPRETHERVPRDEESELAAEFGQGSVADAIRRLIASTAAPSRLSDASRASETIAQRILDERPAGAADLGWALFSALADRREMPAASWRFEGLTQTVHRLGHILTEPQQWEVVRTIVGRLDERDNLSVTQIVEDLDGWCRAVASQDRLERGLDRYLSTQELWLPPGRELRLPHLDTAPEPATWPEFAVACIAETLSCDSGVLNLASMRAMLVLLRLNPRTFDLLLQKAASFARPDREVVAQLAEYVAFAECSEFARFEAFLKHCEHSGCFELELQAWIARCGHARATATQPPRLLLAPLSSGPPKIITATRLVVGAMDKKTASQSTTGKQAVAAVLRQLQHSLNLNASRVESEFLAAIEKDPIRRTDRPRRVRGGDNQFTSTDEIERMYDVLRSGFAGSIDDTFAARLAQAALVQDEPSILFGDWQIRFDIWPTDDELRKLLDEGQIHARQRLSGVLDSGLGDEETVFAGTLYICAYGLEMFMHRLPWFRDDETTVGAQTNQTTFGGRMFAYANPARFEAHEAEAPPCWLALLGRGLSRTPHQNIGVVPSARLQLRGGWVADETRRGAFVAGDGSPVRYERVLGPPRAQVRERCFRDPYVERWVCKRSAIEALERTLRGSISLVPDFEIYKTNDQ
jgi:hypothetical protein